MNIPVFHPLNSSVSPNTTAVNKPSVLFLPPELVQH